MEEVSSEFKDFTCIRNFFNWFFLAFPRVVYSKYEYISTTYTMS